MKKKFIVVKEPGNTQIPIKAEYFVLRIDYHHKGVKNQETYAARMALREYIRFCKGIVPKNKYAIGCAKAAQQALGKGQP